MKALWKREGGNLVYQVTESAEGEKELRARGFMTLDELNDPPGLLGSADVKGAYAAAIAKHKK